MSELNELDVLIAIRDVAVGELPLDALDEHITAALSDTRLPQRRRPGRHITPLLVGIGVLIPVLIAVGAIALLSKPSHSVALPASAPSTTSPAIARRQLVQMLGVLRQPPDAASTQAIDCAKAPPKPASPTFRACRTSGLPEEFPPIQSSRFWARWGNPRLDASLIRVVPVPQLHASVMLTPAIWQPSSRSPLRSEGLDLTIVYHRGSTSTGPRPTPVALVRTHGLAVSGGNATPSMRTVFGAVVVPDGVATVTLDPVRLISPPAPVDPRRFGTVTAPVHDNVATFRFTVPFVRDLHAKSLVYAVTVIANATWTDQHGNVIAHTTTQLPLWLRVQGKTPITATN
jgi:hypothetical protein